MRNLYDECNKAGGMTSFEWERDPKRLLFILARYKFVAKLLHGKKRVLEVGCADGVASRLLLQYVERLDAVDIDADAIAIALKQVSSRWPVNYFVGNILHGPIGKYDAAFALDLFEHMRPGKQEHQFLTNMRACASFGPVVLGMPSLESQVYASALSKKGHVNCKTEADLRATLRQFWNHVFIFGMNDETLHTGFEKMAHYRFALCLP